MSIELTDEQYSSSRMISDQQFFRLLEIEHFYNELLLAVGNKYEGETRHQTAKRYIEAAEQQTQIIGESSPRKVDCSNCKGSGELSDQLCGDTRVCCCCSGMGWRYE